MTKLPVSVGRETSCPTSGFRTLRRSIFAKLWAKTNINSPDSMRVPFANRHDNGELLMLDLKDMNNGGDGPHGVMSGTTGSGKTTALRTLNLGLMTGHRAVGSAIRAGRLQGRRRREAVRAHPARGPRHHRPRRRPDADGPLRGRAVGGDRAPQGGLQRGRRR